MKAYKGLVSAGFNEVVYTDKEDYRALRYVIARGVNLQGFRIERDGEKRSGVILARLMGWQTDTPEKDRKLDIAKYYAARGKMQDLDEAVDGNGCTALYAASCRGYVDIVKGMLAAGANKNKANMNGATPLYIAAQKGHVEVVQAQLSAGADWTKRDDSGKTAEDWATQQGHQEIILLLQQAVQQAAQKKTEKEKKAAKKSGKKK